MWRKPSWDWKLFIGTLRKFHPLKAAINLSQQDFGQTKSGKYVQNYSLPEQKLSIKVREINCIHINHGELPKSKHSLQQHAASQRNEKAQKILKPAF